MKNNQKIMDNKEIGICTMMTNMELMKKLKS